MDADDRLERARELADVHPGPGYIGMIDGTPVYRDQHLQRDGEGRPVPVELLRTEVTDEGLVVTGVLTPPAWASDMLRRLIDASGRPLYSIARTLPRAEPPLVLGPALHAEDLPTEQPAALAVRSRWGRWDYWLLDDDGQWWDDDSSGYLQEVYGPQQLAEHVTAEASEWRVLRG